MAVPGANSAKLFRRACGLFPGGVNSPVRAFRSVGGEPFIVDRGEGAYLVDVDGNRFVDYVCSWGPLVLGHAPAPVVEAIRRQTERGTSYGACCELEAKLAEKIIGFYPSLELMRFVNSGTEAGMTVLRLARAFTGRSKVIKFTGCYHGHLDPLLVEAGSGVATLGIPGSAGVPASSTHDTLSAPFNDLQAVKRLFDEFPKEIAAVMVEPVCGNAGLILPNSEFLSGLRRVTEANGALLIFDEVMTGFRVGLGGAQAAYGIKPDLTMLGKVIGGGLPVGAFGGKREIMSQLAPLGPVYQAGTLSGNPLAMAAGLATIEEWAKPGVFEAASADARTIVAGFRQLSAARDIPLVAESAGTMFGFFLQKGPVANYEEAKRSDTAQFTKLFRLLLERGVYIAPSQFEAGFLSSAHHGDPVAETLAAIHWAFGQLSDE